MQLVLLAVGEGDAVGHGVLGLAVRDGMGAVGLEFSLELFLVKFAWICEG